MDEATESEASGQGGGGGISAGDVFDFLGSTVGGITGAIMAGQGAGGVDTSTSQPAVNVFVPETQSSQLIPGVDNTTLILGAAGLGLAAYLLK